MPANGYSIGGDVSVDIKDPLTGNLVNWSGISGFEADPITHELKWNPLNGAPKNAKVPDGWKGKIMLDRANSAIDDFFARNEDLYFNGFNIPAGTITQTIREVDGSVTTYRFTDVTFSFGKAGSWKAADKVVIEIDWEAGRRKKVI